MNKKQIISLAESMGFELEYDRFYDMPHPMDIYPSPPFMLFVHKDGPKGNKAVKWVWYKDELDEENIANGNHILNFINQTA
jgi:hypothetical protein